MAEMVADATQPMRLADVKRKQELTGTVKRVELYGAFIDVGLETDAILHISQYAGGRRIKDELNPGDEIAVWVDKIDLEQTQLIVSTYEPLAVEWSDLAEGQTHTGIITRLENFGAFVNIGAEKEGLVHISEISHDYIRHPSQAVTVTDEVEVKVLSFSKRKRRINLSIKALLAEPTKEVSDHIEDVFALDEEEFEEDVPTAMEFAIRRAMGTSAPPSKKKASKRQRRDSRRRRDQQDDILGRTIDYRR
ncbi:MAG: S1 RNA-binding domain-containing protein [Candidatus Promineifilaceae bacterium]